MLERFPFVKQHDAMDCGPACLAMVSRYYGKVYTLQLLRERSYITREGVSMLGISDAAESIGMADKAGKVKPKPSLALSKDPSLASASDQSPVLPNRYRTASIVVLLLSAVPV